MFEDCSVFVDKPSDKSTCYIQSSNNEKETFIDIFSFVVVRLKSILKMKKDKLLVRMFSRQTEI